MIENKNIEINYCPICGNIPMLTRESLDYGNGHGYPGHYDYQIKCIVCKLPKIQSADTVYSKSEKEAMLLAIKKWNKQSKEITNKYLLKNSYLKKLIKEEK